MTKKYLIKTASLEEVEIAVEWAAEEGWNPGRNDASCYYTADAKGFLIGYLDSEPIATISVIKYSERFGFLGFYIVKPKYRRQGYGIQIWDAGLAYLKDCNVGLDGVVDQQANYKKSGFKLAFRNRRYEGKGGGRFQKKAGIVPLSSLPFDVVARYDCDFFAADRSHFIKTWISQTNGFAYGVLKEGGLTGYGVIRPCCAGYKIGPLFADDHEAAELLFISLRSIVRSSDIIYLDVPEANVSAVDLAERHQMKVVFETARMYTETAPAISLERTFGITSFEIG